MLTNPFMLILVLIGILLFCIACHSFAKRDFRVIGTIIGSLGLLFVAAGGGLGIPVAFNNQQLGWLSTTQTLPVWRLGFAIPGDSGQPLLFTASNSTCSLNAGDGDGGSQVKSADNKCWLLSEQIEYDVRIWGGNGNGSADNSLAFTNACAALTKGGVLRIPATGHSFKFFTGVTCSRPNVTFKGVSGYHYLEQSVYDLELYAASGSWIKCADLTNACLTLNGVGSGIDGVNFTVNSQPTPAIGWAPTMYPYIVKVTANAVFLKNFGIVAATHCINIEGGSDGNIGKYTYLENIAYDGCFNVGTRFKNVDNTIHTKNLRYTPYWNLNQPGIIPYMVLNKTDESFEYAANLQQEGTEHFLSKCAKSFTNSTVTSGFGAVTFAANEMQFGNTSFNEVAQAACLPGGNGTVVSGVWTGVILHGDVVTNSYAGKCLLDLPSDQVSLTIHGFNVGYGDCIARIGAGAGGNLKIFGGDIGRYSAATTGQTAFLMGVGSNFWLSGVPFEAIRPGTSAGGQFGGAGYPAALHYWTGRQPITPTLQFGGSNANVTYTTRSGYYEMNDKIISFEVKLGWSAKTTPPTGNAAILTGVPFLCQDTGSFTVGYTATVTGASAWQSYIQGNTVFIGFAGATGQTGATDANFPNVGGSSFYGTGQCAAQ